MIEIHFPEVPQGYVAHRMIVAELDLECEPEIEMPAIDRKTDAGMGQFPKHNTGPCSIEKLKVAIERWPAGREFIANDLKEFTNRRLSSYLPRLVKRGYLERVGKQSGSTNKPFFVYRRIA